jgi:hypothetical protein
MHGVVVGRREDEVMVLPGGHGCAAARTLVRAIGWRAAITAGATDTVRRELGVFGA